MKTVWIKVQLDYMWAKQQQKNRNRQKNVGLPFFKFSTQKLIKAIPNHISWTVCSAV